MVQSPAPPTGPTPNSPRTSQIQTPQALGVTHLHRLPLQLMLSRQAALQPKVTEAGVSAYMYCMS